MKKHSCGAILYTIYNNDIYIVLGMEKGEWFPFKGTREKGETNVQTAIREIYEETCEIVNINTIDLKCNYSTKRKHYHIGLAYVPYDNISQFQAKRNHLLNNPFIKNKWAYLEKSEIDLFKLNGIFSNHFHDITYIPIKYYHPYLSKLQNDIHIKIQNKLSQITSSPIISMRNSPYINSDTSQVFDKQKKLLYNIPIISL